MPTINSAVDRPTEGRPLEPVKPPGKPPRRNFKRDITERVTRLFLWAVAAFSIVLGLAFVVAIIVPFCFTGVEKVVTAKLFFSGLGILAGGFQVALGVLLALVGITIDYDLNASAGPAKIKFASASPGLLLILCGNLLIGFAVARYIEYGEKEILGPPPAIKEAFQGEGKEPPPTSGYEVPKLNSKGP